MIYKKFDANGMRHSEIVFKRNHYQVSLNNSKEISIYSRIVWREHCGVDCCGVLLTIVLFYRRMPKVGHCTGTGQRNLTRMISAF